MEWKDLTFFNSQTFKDITNFLNSEIALKKTILPVQNNIYNAMKYTPFNEIKVVILGQDPYPSGNHAHGLSFSTQQSILPKSLINIFKELYQDLDINRYNGDLTDWAKQGILLLNTVLTVENGKANAHRNIGWRILTAEMIEMINKYLSNIIFVLWGKQAQETIPLIDINKHYIIKSAHPSPLSAYRGFFGSKPFSAINDYLQSINIQPINW